MGNEASKKTIPSREKLLTLNVHEKTAGRVVVFDIDSTLCEQSYNPVTESDKKKAPECPVIFWEHEGKVYPHIFIPYLNVLFDYLLHQGVRIVFFSSAVKERNLAVIPELLTMFWGEKKYQALKSKGQFDIFSREDMRKGHILRPEANCVKDLKIVIRDTESLLGVILVEDDISYNGFDQQPCMPVMDLTRWRPFKPVSSSRIYDCKNSVYYIIGFFKTCFEDEKYKDLLLRVAVDQILANKKVWLCEEPAFVRKMVQKGLKEVQKKVPGAVMYKLDISDDTENKTKERSHMESAYESFVRNLMSANIPLSMFYLAKYLFDQFESRLTMGSEATAEFFRAFIVITIETMKKTADGLIEGEPKNHDVIDVCVRTRYLDGIRGRKPIVLVTFIYVENDKEIENTAKKALQHSETQADIKKKSDNYKGSRIVSVGVAYSAKSLLAAYNDHYEDQKMVYLTDIYTK